MAPQGYLASGDGYTLRFANITESIENKRSIVDDTLIYGMTACRKTLGTFVSYSRYATQPASFLTVISFSLARKLLSLPGWR